MAEKKKIHKVAVTSTKKTMSLRSDKFSGLYDPKNEHDSCGLGFIANIKAHRNDRLFFGQLKSRGIYFLRMVTSPLKVLPSDLLRT